MNGLRAHWRRFAAKLGAGSRLLVLLAVVVLVLGVVAPLAYGARGSAGLAAASLAAAICLLGGGFSLVAGEILSGEKLILARLLAEMAFRMGLPLAACVVVLLNARPLVEAGFGIYLLVFYLPVLVVEILLSVARLENRAADDKRVTAYGG
jgi:hypothetical protein